MIFFKKRYPGVSFIVTGVLGPWSNAHGPNEKVHLPYTKKFICCLTEILHEISTHNAKWRENFINKIIKTYIFLLYITQLYIYIQLKIFHESLFKIFIITEELYHHKTKHHSSPFNLKYFGLHL